MSTEEILKKVNEIFIDAFDDEDIVLTAATTAADIDGWDSLMQMNLIEMIEDEFDMRFEMSEVSGMKNVGAMVEIIASRI